MLYCSWGTISVIQASLPYLRNQRSGHIINFSSVFGLVSHPNLSAYHATKHAIEAISEALAQEVHPFNIHVTLVEPGYFRTEFLSSESLGQNDDTATIKDYDSHRQDYAKFSGQQLGNPKKAAEVIVKLTEMPNPPLRLVLGSDSYKMIKENLHAILEDMERYKDISFSTDFKEGE